MEITEKDRQRYAGLLVGIARGETDVTLDSVAQSLLDGGWSARYSHEYLASNALPELVGKLRGDPDVQSARKLFGELAADYEAFSKIQVVSYPIMNLVVPSTGIKLGEGLFLRTVDDPGIEDAERRLRVVLANSPSPENAKEQLVELMRERYGAHKGQAVAEIAVVCRAEIAKERARSNYDEIIDFLNGAATLLYPLKYGVRVGAPGELATGIEAVLILSDPPESFRHTMTRVGPLFPLDITDNDLQRLKESDFWRVTELLAKPREDRTDFEASLMLAMHWYANSLIHRERANQLLSLTIAAETIFTRQRSQIGLSCAEGIAFVLEDDGAHRFAVRERFRELYSMRGDVSHQGLLSISDKDVAELTDLVMRLLLALVGRRDEFATTQDLERWVDSRRLS